MTDNHPTHDFFVGKIPPFLLFEMEFHSLYHVVESHKTDKLYSEINPASQIAFIGLLAYFEAFCKHQFAAIVNIFPSLISEFSKKRDFPAIEFSTIASFEGNTEHILGFLLAEKYDFGTAKSINGLFRDLLSISPFSKKDEDTFNDIVYRRNLLVHHAGYYTLKSIKKDVISGELSKIAFKQAVKIDTDDYHDISDFLFEIAIKITRETVKALKNIEAYNSLNACSPKFAAVDELLHGLYDTL